MEADSHRSKQNRRTALMLLEAIRQDYTGRYSIVTNFVRHWRGDGAK